MKLRNNRGSITIFVLVGLLFMSAFLMLSYANNVNKSKIAKEQFNMLSGTYSYNDGDKNAYDRAYTDLRRQNADIITKTSENSSNLELTKTYAGDFSNFRIYGNSVQDTATYGTPSPTNPVEVQSVGDLVTDTTDENYGKYKIEVKVSGKNLLNPDTVDNNNIYIYSATGIEMTPSATGGTWRASDYIKISAGKTYHLNAINSNASAAGIAWYNSNKTYISGLNTTTINANNGNMTAPANACYIRVSWRIDEGYNPNWENTVQLEEGTVATEFQSYVEPQITNIILDEPLRKVGSSSVDYIDFSTGKVKRNVKEIIFTGSDSTWTVWSSSVTSQTMGVFYSNSDVLGTYSATNIKTGGLSNYFQNNSATALNGADDTLIGKMNIAPLSNPPYIAFKVPYTTLSAWKSFLSTKYSEGNPVRVLYQLKNEDSTETISLPQLSTYEDYTRIEVLTEIAPSKIEATYYGY